MSDAVNAELHARRDQLIRQSLRKARWTRRWLHIVLVGLTLYVGLPFVAPTLMAVGATGPANVLYTLYSPLCHQFAFRSFFLYGEQAVYPREAVDGNASLETFDQRAARSEEFVRIYEEARRAELRRAGMDTAAQGYRFQPQELQTWTTALQSSARQFRGDEEMGYKVALCERDIAIYAAMVVAGMLFIPVRRRLRPPPLLLYALLGLAPIGLDGFSQLLGYPPFEFWEVRETLPEFRVLTGALFGFMTAWLAFPYLEKSMIESARETEALVADMQQERSAPSEG